MAKTYNLKINSAVVIGGAIVRPGKTVEVSETLARNLLHRGKAELADKQPGPKKAKGPVGTNGKGGAAPQGEKPADEA